jgi:iron complex outermembrane receptor protein
MRLGVAVAVACLSAMGLSVADDVKASIRKPTNIPAEALGPALQTLANERGFQVAYVSDEVASRRTQGAVGELTTNEALTKLLSGTGLTYRYFGDKAVSIIPIGSVDASGGASTQAQVDGSGGASSSEEEGKKKSSSAGFRLAQGDQGQTSSPSTVEKQNEQASKSKAVQLEEVVVTGSRIPTAKGEGAQDVKIYTRETIEQSGQSTVADFLNTLPSVSVSITEAGQLTAATGTTVQLHGLPIGSTLVLLNGRRVEASGTESFFNFFDLNNIPLSMVDRIEVVSEGSSAIYGSDAIAGVVNIILKKSLNGIEASAKYGWASGTDQVDTDVGFGKQWTKGSVSLFASYETRTELERSQRAITSTDDHTPQGGSDFRSNDCSPGNIFSTNGGNLPGVGAPFAAVPVGFTGTPTQQEFVHTAGTLNSCSNFRYLSLIPASHRVGVFGQGNFNVTSSVELFAEFLYSHTEQRHYGGPNELFGVPGFQQFTVSASNPFNPFGETVGISTLYPTVGRTTFPVDTDFLRPLVGARGSFLGEWQWEVAGWDSEDSGQEASGNQFNSPLVQAALNSPNPAAALNPFVDGPGASSQLLRSFLFDSTQRFFGQTLSANGFVRGPALKLPSGPVELVLGGEYDRQKLYSQQLPDSGGDLASSQRLQRHNYAFFAEARIPIVATPTSPQGGERLAITLADRYDSYSDFGQKNTPQFGVELRPVDTLLVRGTYGRAFQAPSLFQLGAPVTTYTTTVTDPLRGNQLEVVTATSGGNPKLKPETGNSRTFGFVYSSDAVPGLRVAITQWDIDENNSIQSLNPITIIANESLFPGDVVRAPNCAGGPPCPITNVSGTFANFGRIDMAGLDYQLSYKVTTGIGILTPSLNATETYRYRVGLTPNALPTDAVSKAQDSGDWAPRWKGTAALGWKFGPYSANVDGRYVGHYQDYDSTRKIGNFWFWDANVRYAVGQQFAPSSEWLRNSYIEFGGVNMFNSLPQYSNFYFGIIGYDEAQADIRGRFLYVRAGIRY